MRAKVMMFMVCAGAALAGEAMAQQGVAELRLLPPQARLAMPSQQDMQAERNTQLRILRERHPEVVDSSNTGQYIVTLLLNAEGGVVRSSARRGDNADLSSVFREAQPELNGARMSIARWPAGSALPDGKTAGPAVVLVSGVLPAGFDPSRDVSKVHQAVRATLSNLTLPRSGGTLNRLSIFLNENGTIARHAVEPFSTTELRRAPLEDDQFAVRMADRIAGVLNMDARLMGVVGFTYVDDPAVPMIGATGAASSFVEPRTVLVQYAWPRKAGETGPSSPMTAPAQPMKQSFDQATALRLVEHHIPDAFTNTSRAAGTPTIVLNARGEVVRAGRVQYGSGANHEKLIGEQLVPGIRTANFMSPTLTNSAGMSATVSFAWQMP